MYEIRFKITSKKKINVEKKHDELIIYILLLCRQYEHLSYIITFIWFFLLWSLKTVSLIETMLARSLAWLCRLHAAGYLLCLTLVKLNARKVHKKSAISIAATINWHNRWCRKHKLVDWTSSGRYILVCTSWFQSSCMPCALNALWEAWYVWLVTLSRREATDKPACVEWPKLLYSRLAWLRPPVAKIETVVFLSQCSWTSLKTRQHGMFPTGIRNYSII